MHTVYFQIGKAEVFPLAPEFIAIVDALKLPENNSKNITIHGHTCKLPVYQEDTKARYGTNQRLSNHRAQNVLRYLVEAGIDASRISLVNGCEYTDPSQETLVNPEKDRRVEIHLS